MICDMIQGDKIVVGTLDSHEFQLKPRVSKTTRFIDEPNRFIDSPSRFIDATHDITDRDRAMFRYYELKLRIQQKDMRFSQEDKEALDFIKSIGLAIGIFTIVIAIVCWVLLKG